MSNCLKVKMPALNVKISVLMGLIMGFCLGLIVLGGLWMHADKFQRDKVVRLKVEIDHLKEVNHGIKQMLCYPGSRWTVGSASGPVIPVSPFDRLVTAYQSTMQRPDFELLVDAFICHQNTLLLMHRNSTDP